jgi:hypothetical protein
VEVDQRSLPGAGNATQSATGTGLRLNWTAELLHKG